MLWAEGVHQKLVDDKARAFYCDPIQYYSCMFGKELRDAILERRLVLKTVDSRGCRRSRAAIAVGGLATTGSRP